jgi:hypothetical protein
MSAPLSLSQSWSWPLLAAVFLLAGCDDSLKSVSLIEETRVLGARVEVASDATRSSPEPGESARLRLFVAAPSEPFNVSYTLSVCAVSPVNSGSPTCAGAPFASTQQAEPETTAPELDFQVPADLDLSRTPHGFASALVCPDTTLVQPEMGAASCTDGAGTEVNFEFDLGGPDSENHSPRITAGALTFDGEAWLEPSAAAACPGDLPSVAAGSKHTLSITLQDADFEPLAQTTAIEPARETLLVSQFSNAGKLDHAFLSLSADTPATDRQVTWEAPASAETPSLVRFYFVVRDARGGEDFSTRAACLVP